MGQFPRSTAAMPVISGSDLGVVVMRQDDFARETIYQCTSASIREWLNTGLIDEAEYLDLLEFFEAKYKPIIGSVCLT